MERIERSMNRYKMKENCLVHWNKYLEEMPSDCECENCKEFGIADSIKMRITMNRIQIMELMFRIEQDEKIGIKYGKENKDNPTEQ